MKIHNYMVMVKLKYVQSSMTIDMSNALNSIILCRSSQLLSSHLVPVGRVHLIMD